MTLVLNVLSEHMCKILSEKTKKSLCIWNMKNTHDRSESKNVQSEGDTWVD